MNEMKISNLIIPENNNYTTIIQSWYLKPNTNTKLLYVTNVYALGLIENYFIPLFSI